MRKIIAFIILIGIMGIGITQARAFPNNFLEDEAGIAAFFQFTGQTNLKSNLLRNIFRTISIETPDYLVGFIPVEGLESGNNQDVKVFIHNSGWVVAFYPREDPSAKIYKQDQTATRLERTLQRLADSLEVTAYTVHYHHFQYPAAERMVTAKLSGSSSKTLDFRLPGANKYFERSWYLSAWALFSGARLSLDGREIGNAVSALKYGIIAEDDLVPNSKHLLTFSGSMGGGESEIVILYSGDQPVIVNGADSLALITIDPVPPELNTAAEDVPFFVETYIPSVWK